MTATSTHLPDTEAAAIHDAHVQAWLRLHCPYARLSYIKQACYYCNALTLCHHSS